MKKPLLFLLSIFLVYQINAQNQNITDEDCPPVPWVFAELMENEQVYITWDAPCDTCHVIKYRLGGINYNPCNINDTTGTFSPFATTLNHSYTLSYHHYYNAISVRAEYDSCNSESTRSNLIIYDSTWYNQTFQLTVNVSLEDDGNPEGAYVKVDGANCYFEALTYEKQADSEGETLFDEVMHGTYDIVVSLPGYHNAVVEDLYMNQDSTINVELKINYVDIKENTHPDQINIFPNPATDRINIQSKETILQIELVNCLGQNVISIEPNQKELLINTSGLVAGVYLVKINTIKGATIKRLIINNFN